MKLFIVFCAIILCVSGRITPNFPRCKKSDPYLNKCLIDGIETLRTDLKTGVPEIGIPAVDPFVLQPFEINRNDNSLKVKGIIQGMGYGGGAFKIDKLNVNIKDKHELELHLTIPTLDITADYKIQELSILMFDFAGKGKFSGKFTDVKAVVKISSTPIVKNGLEYWKMDDLSVKVKIDDGNISVKDEEHPTLAWSMTKFFNASPSTVLNIMGPVIDETATKVVEGILEKVFDKLPISELIVNN